MTHEMQWKCLSEWNACVHQTLRDHADDWPQGGRLSPARAWGRHARRIYAAPLFGVLEWRHRDREFRTGDGVAADAGHDDLPLKPAIAGEGDAAFDGSL